MDFDEIATSDGVTQIHFYVFKYNGNLEEDIKNLVKVGFIQFSM